MTDVYHCQVTDVLLDHREPIRVTGEAENNCKTKAYQSLKICIHKHFTGYNQLRVMLNIEFRLKISLGLSTNQVQHQAYSQI